jgi:hypothetical protein
MADIVSSLPRQGVPAAIRTLVALDEDLSIHEMIMAPPRKLGARERRATGMMLCPGSLASVQFDRCPRRTPFRPDPENLCRAEELIFEPLDDGIRRDRCNPTRNQS